MKTIHMVLRIRIERSYFTNKEKITQSSVAIEYCIEISIENIECEKDLKLVESENNVKDTLEVRLM